MIAEIYGKISGSGSNLSDRLEDQLTGNFFGCMRYLPFNSGMKKILQKSVHPTGLFDCLENTHREEWHESIRFWQDCSFERTEPDVVIELDDTVILVEVKLWSGLSSDDDNDPQAREDKIESNNQLGRESRLLATKYSKYKNKVLLLVAPEASATEIFRNISERQRKGERIIADGVDFGYSTWQRVLENLMALSPTDPFQVIIIYDLVNLLKRKGFERFNSFDGEMIAVVNPNDCWEFNYTAVPDFKFGYCRTITEGLYYEFK